MALLLQAYGTLAQHRPSASGEGLAFAPISHLCGGPRARESAPRHPAQAQLATLRLEEPAGPAARTPATPSVFARRAIIRTVRLILKTRASRPRDRPGPAAHGTRSPVSISMAMPAVPGTARRRRGGRRGVRASPALPSAHTVSHTHTLRAPRPATRPAHGMGLPTTDLPSRLGRASTTANSTWTSPRSHVLARARGKGSILVILKGQLNHHLRVTKKAPPATCARGRDRTVHAQTTPGTGWR